MNKGYCFLKLVPEDAKKIKEICKIANLDCLDVNKFHCTLMYDKSNPDIDILSTDKVFVATIKDAELLGEKGSKWEAVALVLDSPDIVQRHKELKNAGFSHSYDEFLPHMTISYQPNDTDLDITKLLVKLGSFPEKLHFSTETFEELTN